MRVHFALGDVATLRLEDVFDRILQRDDVLAPLQVHLLDERGQRGRFSAADRTGDEDQAILIARQQLQCSGKPELVHRSHSRVDDAENQIDAQPLPHHAGPKTPELIRVGEVRIAALGPAASCADRKENLRPAPRFLSAVSRGASGQIGCSVPCNRQIGGAFTPR